jgi:hypothetical protein
MDAARITLARLGPAGLGWWECALARPRTQVVSYRLREF